MPVFLANNFKELWTVLNLVLSVYGIIDSKNDDVTFVLE